MVGFSFAGFQRHAELIHRGLRMQREILEQQRLQMEMQTLREQQNLLRAQRQAQELLQATGQRRVRHEEISVEPHEFFPASTYWNATTRQTVDINQKLVDGDVLTDKEMKQVMLDLDILRYSAGTDAQRQMIEILEENTQNRIVENVLNNAPVTEDGLIQVFGLELYPEEAELAVTLDVEHFREKEAHLRPEEIRRKLVEFAIELWDVAYGEDIRTLLDNDAHALQRVWAGLQFIPALKVAKLAKIGRFAKFFRKSGNLGANPFKGKTPTQIHKMMTKRGFKVSEKYPGGSLEGYGGYVHPKTGRSYHIDPKEFGKYREPGHIDVNRPKGYKGPLDKRRYPGVIDKE